MASNRYEIQCKKCNYSIIIEVDPDSARLRVYCQQCRYLMLDHFVEPTTVNAHEDVTKTLLQGGGTQLGMTQANIQVPPSPMGSTQSHIKMPPAQKPVEGQKTQKFANYLVSKVLGSGAMGKVYLAKDERTGEDVALKVLQKANDPKSLDYFIREVQVLLDLNHPNIVKLQGWGNHMGYPYLAMEYFPGNALGDLLKKEPIPPVYAVQIICYVLDALIYAEEHQIIHRDIKPANIFIAHNGMVKVIDLGLGKILADSNGLTQTGQIMGTGFYMPEEQLRDAKRADHRADIYAVGATLYHCLSALPPFGEYGKNLNKLIMGKVNNSYISLQERCPDLSTELIDIVAKAMAHKPDGRYPNALTMKKDLVAFYKTIAKKP